uniref:Transmembrane protein 104 n=1 Tax=Lygus hesperus TaxID=30085 RepID=A0A0A9X4J8_LYGHE
MPTMDDQYSSYTALLYVFNLIVGTGALALPKAFDDAGWLLSTISMIVMALMSYITATFVIEAISRCHSILQWERVERMKAVSRVIRSAIDPDEDEEAYDSTEDSLMLPPEYIENFPSQPQKMFTLDVKVEMSVMANTVFNHYGQILFYICLCVYLYGDLTIYSAAVSKSIVDTFCNNATDNATMSTMCWEGYNFTVGGVYKICLGCFLLLLGPYVFFNVQKTKFLQMITSVSRWLTFSLMIGLAIWRMSSPSFEHGSPSMAKWLGTPAMFGSSIYSFMCHHSLPGLISPIKDKKNLYAYLAFDYLAILAFYLTLCLTAVFAFPSIQELYTLNFAPNMDSEKIGFLGYVLALFPVYTLTTSFPIIAITLRGNLQAMFVKFQWRVLHSVILPIVAVVPPVIIAMTTLNIETLVYITGAFGGVAIQYIIPTVLVVLSRIQTPPALVRIPNPHDSPFKSIFWAILVFLWAMICYGLVLYNLFTSKLDIL